MMNQKNRIGFIGAGNMATALVKGLIADGHNPSLLSAGDPDSRQRTKIQALGVAALEDNALLVQQVDVLILAIKPQLAEQVLPALSSAVIQSQPLVLSIMAGIGIDQMKALLRQPKLSIVRAMPNTPALVGESVTALYGVGLSESHVQQTENIIRAIGLLTWLSKESMLDAVTALSGSGPAYFLLLMEAMIEAGVSLGLNQEQARILTLQTAYGSGKLALRTEQPPASLRNQVTSPGGTTEAALQVLIEGGFKDLVASAIRAAGQRSKELGFHKSANDLRVK